MKKIVFWFLSTLFFMTIGATAQAQTCKNPQTLRLAVIPQIKNQKVVEHYDALVSSLKKELSRNVILVPMRSYSAVIEGLLNQSIDLAELGPGSYALAKQHGAEITVFASLHKRTDSNSPDNYSSVLITKGNSDIQSFKELQGSSLSLVDPVSTSGGLVPRLFVQRKTGMPLETWFGRVVFSGTHDAAIEAVLTGRVTAAFVSDTLLEEKGVSGQPIKNLLRVLWRSEPIPVDPFVYQTGLCDFVKRMIEQAFFEPSEDLQRFFSWRNMQGFVPASKSDYRQFMQ